MAPVLARHRSLGRGASQWDRGHGNLVCDGELLLASTRKGAVPRNVKEKEKIVPAHLYFMRCASDARA